MGLMSITSTITILGDMDSDEMEIEGNQQNTFK